MSMLNEACEHFSSENKRAIHELVRKAFFDIGSAEAKEAKMRGNIDLAPDEYLENIKLKVSLVKLQLKLALSLETERLSKLKIWLNTVKHLGS